MGCFEHVKKLFCKKSRNDIAEYRALIEKEVQEHWKDHQIRLKELIWDCWQDPAAVTKESASIQKFNYVVFIDIEGDLDWICNDDHVDNKVPSKTYTLIASIMDVEAKPCKHLGEAEWMAFKRMLGTAIVSAFEGGSDEARALMLEAKAYLEQRIPERSRLWTLHSATLALVLYGLTLYAIRDTILIAPFMFGLFGAYVSLIRHASTRRADSNAGECLHCTEAFVRLLIGMMLGKMGVLFFSCSIAPEFSRSICATYTGVRVIAFASGLFDAFIPAMISSYVLTQLNEKETIHD